ncbi:uncharacterized protein HVO_A0015 (plasmid) [Haloferax volcanii DS2]|uniref:Uncharacterized protein n=1 Tax=Haloferax volcanii (strain ATCC 29605 / DSM 3757 / JCM 8879 / NBRC 14742 / NCIMB 2012 / VKM B-1768 / DS2) TaxID=309800 RepID=A0A8D3W5D0_HALVD|nr:uncharacterized protein HVO_A0015 [Haloferax volcanii DS2]
MDSLKMGRNVGWTLVLAGVIGVILTSGPMPSGPAMAAHPSLRGQLQIERLVGMVSIVLSIVGIFIVVGTSFIR